MELLGCPFVGNLSTSFMFAYPDGKSAVLSDVGGFQSILIDSSFTVKGIFPQYTIKFGLGQNAAIHLQTFEH